MSSSDDGLRSWIRRSLLAVGLLGGIIAGGTVGYVVIEGWSLWDAFYMTVITVTTVGYREVHDLSRAGQILTVFVLFGGVGAALGSVPVFLATGTFLFAGGVLSLLSSRGESE